MRKSVALVLALPLVAAPILVAGPATAVGTVKEAKLERAIKKGFWKQAKVSVNVNCPSNVTWVKGKTFYCKARSASGSKYKVRVKLGRESTGSLTWKVVS